MMLWCSRVRVCLAAVLSFLWSQWTSKFSGRPPNERTWVADLRHFRNLWAHNCNLTLYDALRFTDGCGRLLGDV
jgi:hypothetical protein